MTINTFCRSLVRLLLLCLLLLSLQGCGQLQLEKRQRFFWPPPPGVPKIEYINFYFSTDDLKRGVDSRFEDAILGRRLPERLIFQPYSVASDGKERLFVADLTGGVIHVFEIENHKYRKMKEGINGLQKVFVDSYGDIWALNNVNGSVLHFSSAEKELGEIKLSGLVRASSFAVDRSRSIIYLVDTAQHQLRVYDLEGHFLRTIGKRGPLAGEFNFPGDIDLDAKGNLYIVDVLNARIQILAPDGTALKMFGERGTARGAFSIPKGIAVSPSGLIYVTDATQHKLVIFDAEGEYLLTIGARFVYTDSDMVPGGFNFPAGIDVDNSEAIWVADLMNGMVHKFQYLTPEYLTKKPILPKEIYYPSSTDFRVEDDGPLLPEPVN